jgi:MFS transporter, DHA1 family, multidrug resistance protein
LIVLRFLHGLATAVFGPIAMAVVADLFKGTRGVALGSYTAATQAGAMLGPLLGGWLVTMSGFRWAFVAAGLAGCMAFLLFLVIRWPPQARHAAAGTGAAGVMRDMAKGARTVIKNFRVMVTSATDGARQIANGALMAFLPIYVVSLGMDAAQAGLLFGVQSVTSFVSRPTMGWASDRIGRRPLIIWGLITCALTIAAIPHTRTFPGLLMLCALFGFGEAIVNASAAALVADLSELKTLGSAMGMQGAIMDIGHASGPILAGFLVGGLGFQSAFLIIGGVVLVAAAGFRLAVTHEP